MFNELFSLRDVGSTYLTECDVNGLFNDPYYFYLQCRLCVQSCSFFLWEGEYFYLSICPVMKLSHFYLLNEVFSVRFESVFFARVYRHHYMIGLCDSYCHLLTQSYIYWLYRSFYFQHSCD